MLGNPLPGTNIPASGAAPAAPATQPQGTFDKLTGGLWGKATNAQVGDMTTQWGTPITYGSGIYPALGGGLAALLTPSPTPSSLNNASQLPPGFTDHAHPLNTNFGQLLGNNQTTQAQTAGFNAVDSVTGHPYNFFPQQDPNNPTQALRPLVQQAAL